MQKQKYLRIYTKYKRTQKHKYKYKGMQKPKYRFEERNKELEEQYLQLREDKVGPTHGCFQS